MKKRRLLLAVLILSTSGWVSAGVPIIKLHESRMSKVNYYPFVALNNNSLWVKDNMKTVWAGADPGMHGLQAEPVADAEPSVFPGILNNLENASTLTGRQVSEGSFSSYAGEAFTSSSSIAPVSGARLSSAERRYGLMVASPSVPKIWAVLLLAIGCVIYQGRRRQRLSGFEGNRLNAGSVPV